MSTLVFLAKGLFHLFAGSMVLGGYYEAEIMIQCCPWLWAKAMMVTQGQDRAREKAQIPSQPDAHGVP